MVLECYKLFKDIEKRPGMFIGEVSLDRIKLFATGYYTALVENKLIIESKNEAFFDWIARKLGYYESTAGWGNMILAYSLGFDPEEIIWEEVFSRHITKEEHIQSIKMFYELLEEYKNEMKNENNTTL
ncbi:hypothetical protein [Flavobacterium foetidum]|uniref:hypothetical protein n=1 Tax=Flavobacterium foetidum TaxID=2026681 RepID=UPI001075448B|nr:hypothetical protein [Flavobacterium foetidum]KAF2513869.1 hypothetical protein E0W73_13660 [Flavobacterium foetidum]